MNKVIGTKETMEIKKGKESTSKKKNGGGGVKKKEDQETKKEEDVVITVRMRWTNARWVWELKVESDEWVTSLYQRVLGRLWKYETIMYFFCS